MKCKFCGSEDIEEYKRNVGGVTQICKKCNRINPDDGIIQVYRNNGRYFGYPECCIEQFVQDLINGDFSAQLRCGTEDGYVPCDKCLKNFKKVKGFLVRIK